MSNYWKNKLLKLALPCDELIELLDYNTLHNYTGTFDTYKSVVKSMNDFINNDVRDINGKKVRGCIVYVADRRSNNPKPELKSYMTLFNTSAGRAILEARDQVDRYLKMFENNDMGFALAMWLDREYEDGPMLINVANGAF